MLHGPMLMSPEEKSQGRTVQYMLLHLSTTPLLQWKAKNNEGANFKWNLLIRKAFKGYLTSPGCA